MRHAVARVVVAAAVVAAFIAAADRGSSATGPAVIDMRQMDIGYRLGEGALKIRATLATGEAFEYSTSDARDVQTILAVAQACGQGAVSMSAVVEERTLTERSLRAIQCAIRPVFAIAR